MQKAHVRQHYIPQFILKNFCRDRSEAKVFFFETGKTEPIFMFVSNVFMEKHLYSRTEGQEEVETSLAQFEAEIAPIFKRFAFDKEVSLTFEEDERLRIFLSLLAFRAVSTREQFGHMPDFSKALYSGGSDDMDMQELWLKNVYRLSQCRNIKEVRDNPEVSELLKLFICNEFSGFYLCLLERRGEVDFHISDCYPVVMSGGGVPNAPNLQLPIYYFYPISNSRMLVLVTNHIKDVPKSVAYLDCDKIFKGPKHSSDRAHICFYPQKVYLRDVEWMNKMIVENAQSGVVVKDLDRCSAFLQ